MRDERLVGPGLAAQLRSLPGEGLVELAVRRPLEDPGDLGQQVTPAAGQRAEFVHRGGVFVFGERAPPGAVPGLAGDLGDQDPVGSRS